MMSDVRDVWRKSHGYTGEDLAAYAEDLDWLLDDPRYQDPDFTPPESLTPFFRLGQAMEADVIRFMTEGPPYEPRMELDGALAASQIHGFYPRRWVEFLTRMGMPEPAITDEMIREWDPLLEEGVALRNGNMLSIHPWALTDPAWTLVTPSYVAMMLDPSIKVPFGTTPAWITIDDADSLTLALTGDWGTGSWDDGAGQLSPPDAVMAQIEELGVDYTIHLGDVYPLGNPTFYNFFLQGWKPGRRGSFTLNSNHDMYAWGKGYFEDAMAHPMFAAQQGTSYFALEFGDWIIVGLDSAYHDTSPLMFQGTISDPGQTAFLRKVREQADETGQQVFVLTHHHPLMPEGTEATPLWYDVVDEQALGKAPDVWYYGHYHAAAVYSQHSVVGGTTKARVMGHGAIPFTAPDELVENTGPGKPIECYAGSPYPDDAPEHRGRSMNGFAAVTLTRDGGMEERFINQDGSDMCA